MALVPSALLIVILVGYATYKVSVEYITVALERFSRLNVTTTAHALEQYIESCRHDLVYMARQPLSSENMRRYIEDMRQTRGITYTEFGFITKQDDDHLVFVATDDNIVQMSAAQVNDIRPTPALLYRQVNHLEEGEVWLSPVREVEYPFPIAGNPNNRIAVKVLRMLTPYHSPSGERLGYLYLSIDGRKLRNILSLYNSEESPVFAFPRNPTLQRYFYFFDADGWVLFESEPLDQPQTELSTMHVRADKQGTLGRPGLPGAFRPLSGETRYWLMLEEIAKGEKGLFKKREDPVGSGVIKEYFLAYAPVKFRSSGRKALDVIGGVAFIDRSKLTEVAGYRHFDVMVIIIVAAGLVLTLVIVLVAGSATHPLLEMARAVKNLRAEGSLQKISVARSGYEAEVLQDAINTMIMTINEQVEEIRLRDKTIESVALKEPAPLGEVMTSQGECGDVFPEFIGSGTLMDQLKSDILKAAQVDVDVLIVGETGTGKQLAAEAVHRLSRRSGSPFTSINCGELDESLLLDTLFGHVKGAFTDGKGDRKGAFLEAHGGTLFLDEIQSASPRVQQSLLRAIAMRKVKPLGSDKEVDVDVRLITATNVDLKGLMEERKFREDLYYRLKVITVHTPALREQRENIPALATYYLKEAEKMAGRQGLAISRGALEKLMNYHWPGNIRELKNVIITAGVMAEGRIIQAEQLSIEPEDAAVFSAPLQSIPAPPVLSSYSGPTDGASDNVGKPGNGSDGTQAMADLPPDLNPRQLAAYVHALRNGEITRKEYQALLGNSVSKRTASYDIENLVERGLLIKVGRGPTTRYVLPKD